MRLRHIRAYDELSGGDLRHCFISNSGRVFGSFIALAIYPGPPHEGAGWRDGRRQINTAAAITIIFYARSPVLDPSSSPSCLAISAQKLADKRGLAALGPPGTPFSRLQI